MCHDKSERRESRLCTAIGDKSTEKSTFCTIHNRVINRYAEPVKHPSIPKHKKQTAKGGRFLRSVPFVVFVFI